MSIDDLLARQHTLGEGRKVFVRSVFKLLGQFTDHPLDMTEAEVYEGLIHLKKKEAFNGKGSLV